MKFVILIVCFQLRQLIKNPKKFGLEQVPLSTALVESTLRGSQISLLFYFIHIYNVATNR